jgi:hypothetical protein
MNDFLALMAQCRFVPIFAQDEQIFLQGLRNPSRTPYSAGDDAV